MPGRGNPFYRFVALCWGRAWRGDCATVWLPEVGAALTMFPVTSPTHSLYATGALPAVALVFSPTVGGFAVKWSFLKIQQFLLPPQHPLVFTARSYGDLSSWLWNPELGLGSLAPKVSFPIFIHHT